ncbi:hypothetical protein [Iningainema tapete]|uniref:Uncharacterized protein n=1 Tax=Iningainema tapete BLCC-T55 TaxID=2748662 RepID=A0A8J6XIP8_9CYAN|nr:hypothetical protein [Iningainema tapete]MBD2775178.1 hypothetical protein [Iningainema tapete BLCC-T55]
MGPGRRTLRALHLHSSLIATMPCNNGNVAMKNKTTWTNINGSWQHGKTKVIRVPEALAERILEYARAIDASAPISDTAYDIPDRYGDVSQQQEIILQALASYVKWKRKNYHPNQNSKQLNTDTRAWDEFRKFQTMVQENPELLI